jgi:MFS transporter, ACS family, pantothenate transporter
MASHDEIKIAPESPEVAPESISSDKKNTLIEDSEVPATQERSSTWRRIAGFFWDSVDGDAEYRKYVQRLDLIFLFVHSIVLLPPRR